jgi:hypothetical protein
MRLGRMRVQGFRCLFRSTPQDNSAASERLGMDSEPGVEIRFDRLSTLIGCNDAGKSSVLDALHILLNDARPDPADFHRPLPSVPKPPIDSESSAVDEIEICAEFILEGDRDSEAQQYAIGNALTARVICASDSLQMEYLCEVPVDDRLAQDFSKMKAEAQKALISDLDPSASGELSNMAERSKWLRTYALSSPRKRAWSAVPRALRLVLPRFERYSAIDYSLPENIVIKTLRQVYEGVIYEQYESSETIGRRLIKPLRDLKSRVDADVHAKVQELLDYIRRYNPQVRDVSFDPTLEFSGALRTGYFQIDDGRGFQYLVHS